MKKIFPIVVVLLVVVGGAIWFFGFKNKKTSESVATPTPAEKEITEIPLEKRPYVSLTPRADGKEFTLDIGRIENTETVEYELVYLSQGISRGVIGSVNLSGEKSISRKLLLGSCSRNVCKYDEGVEQGTLTMRFRGPNGTSKFTTDFHLQKGTGPLTSVDGKFELDGKFSTTSFYLTMNTVGLPGIIDKTVADGPYGVFTSGSSTIKNGTVKLGPQVYFWNGSTWQVVENSVSQLGVFVAVSS